MSIKLEFQALQGGALKPAAPAILVPPGQHRRAKAARRPGLRTGRPCTAVRCKVVLVVNTASECGYTPQYAELQALWDKYRERGLVVLGVPCNDFGAQEPGGAAQIGAFCQKNYGVSFPLAAKVEILNVRARHPFYQAIAAELGEDQLPRWNFHKYLVGGDGELLGSWPPKVAPLSAEITTAVEQALRV